MAYLTERDGECVLEFTYQGFIKILTDSGGVKIIDAFIVYDDEDFNYDPVENYLIHTPKYPDTEEENNRRKIVGAYSRAILEDNSKHFHFVEGWKLRKIEGLSNTPNYSDWRSDMYKKTAIRSHYKFLPKKDLPEYAEKAIVMDEQNTGIEFRKSGKKKGLIDFFSNYDQ